MINELKLTDIKNISLAIFNTHIETCQDLFALYAGDHGGFYLFQRAVILKTNIAQLPDAVHASLLLHYLISINFIQFPAGVGEMDQKQQQNNHLKWKETRCLNLTSVLANTCGVVILLLELFVMNNITGNNINETIVRENYSYILKQIQTGGLYTSIYFRDDFPILFGISTRYYHWFYSIFGCSNKNKFNSTTYILKYHFNFNMII